MCTKVQLKQTELHFLVLADSRLLIYKATGWQSKNSCCATIVQMVLWRKKKLGPNVWILVQFACNPVIFRSSFGEARAHEDHKYR